MISRVLIGALYFYGCAMTAKCETPPTAPAPVPPAISERLNLDFFKDASEINALLMQIEQLQGKVTTLQTHQQGIVAKMREKCGTDFDLNQDANTKEAMCVAKPKPAKEATLDGKATKN